MVEHLSLNAIAERFPFEQTMEIEKLIHLADFSFNTAGLGEIRCGPLGSELSKYDKMARDGVDGVELARGMVLDVGHKVTGNSKLDEVAGGPVINEEEIKLISTSELDEFSDKFIALRLRDTVDSRSFPVQRDDQLNPKPTGCMGLGKAIIAHTDSQRAQVERIVGQARSGILSRTAFSAIGKSAIDNAMKGSTLGGSISEQLQRFKDGGVVGKLQREALKESVLGAALRTVKASDNLGETIAVLRALNSSANFATPVEPSTINVAMPHFPPNPIVETNELLRKQQSYAEEMRPTIIRAAELIQTLTDTILAVQTLANDNSSQAERHARRSMMVAVVSIIIAVITGGISIYYANLSPTAEQLDRLASDYIKQLRATSASAEADRIALANKRRDDQEQANRSEPGKDVNNSNVENARSHSSQRSRGTQK